MKRKDYGTLEEGYINNAMALLGVKSQNELERYTGIHAAAINRIRKGQTRFLRSLFLSLLEMTDKSPSEMRLELGMPPDYFEDKR